MPDNGKVHSRGISLYSFWVFNLYHVLIKNVLDMTLCDGLRGVRAESRKRISGRVEGRAFQRYEKDY